MKRLLPIFLAAGVMLLAGCHLNDEGTLAEHAEPASAGVGDSVTHTDAEPTGGTPTAQAAGNAGGQTAAAFPASTPPSDQPSVTALNYWAPRRVNTEPPHAEGSEHEPASGAPAHTEEAH